MISPPNEDQCWSLRQSFMRSKFHELNVSWSFKFIWYIPTVNFRFINFRSVNSRVLKSTCQARSCFCKTKTQQLSYELHLLMKYEAWTLFNLFLQVIFSQNWFNRNKDTNNQLYMLAQAHFTAVPRSLDWNIIPQDRGTVIQSNAIPQRNSQMILEGSKFWFQLPNSIIMLPCYARSGLLRCGSNYSDTWAWVNIKYRYTCCIF